MPVGDGQPEKPVYAMTESELRHEKISLESRVRAGQANGYDVSRLNDVLMYLAHFDAQKQRLRDEDKLREDGVAVDPVMDEDTSHMEKSMRGYFPDIQSNDAE